LSRSFPRIVSASLDPFFDETGLHGSPGHHAGKADLWRSLSKQLTGPSGKHNLRMMVKLLEECGFVDVNVFEELQPIKLEKNVS
jgi:hypothetical protein